MSAPEGGSLGRRRLRSFEAFAVLVGMLVGAGIFRVTGVASAETGAGVVLVYLALTPVVLATSVAYAVFLSSAAGEGPGGEVRHLEAVFGEGRLVFLVAWAKWIAYVGAIAFLAQTLADYALALAEMLGITSSQAPGAGVSGALGVLFLFFVLHASGVRWMARAQVWMCVLLLASILVLVLPGLFAVRWQNYSPMFPHGAGGFLRAMPPAFFAFAGFEVLAHASGEVEGGRERLPRIFRNGILATAAIFVSMSFVAFGALPAERLAAEGAPMAAAAAVYLPRGAAALVALGAVLAVATSVNGSMLVPARLTLAMARRGLLPRALATAHGAAGTPLLGLIASTLASALLLVTGQLSLALGIAVFALVVVYLLNSVALLVLPRRNPELYGSVRVSLSRRAQVASALLAIAVLATLIAVQLAADVHVLRTTTFAERLQGGASTVIELALFWGLLGGVFYETRRRAQASG